MPAIVDTACTKSVAGRDWYEMYADWAAAHGYVVVTQDQVDQFKFGASKLFTSRFVVEAWFGVAGRFFCVTVSIVPCSAPLLLSRPVLAALGTQYDLAAERVDLEALDLKAVDLRVSPTGHPAIVRERLRRAGREIPFDRSQRRVGEVGFPTGVAYMSAYGDGGGWSCKPKKLPSEAFRILAEPEVLSGNGFWCWWQSVKHNRDFWVETADELIRTHVVPCATLFNPKLWNTTHELLKKSLLDHLRGKRITEFIPCLAKSVIVAQRVSTSFVTLSRFENTSPGLAAAALQSSILRTT